MLETDHDTDTNGNVDASTSTFESLWTDEALRKSRDHARAYLEAHAYPSASTNRVASTLGLARLEWVLQDAREGISGMFSEDDFRVMLNIYLQKVFSPFDISELVGTVGDGLIHDEWPLSVEDYPPLLKKLCELSAVRVLALADALEQAWHHSHGFARHPFDVVRGLGIELN